MKISKGSIAFAIILLITLGIFSEQAFSQKKLKPSKQTSQNEEKNVNKSIVIATIGDDQITYEELEKAFKKNINRKDVNLNEVSKDSLMDFIKLYTNYRLKVKDAISRGFDKDSAVLADIESNRKILAESFFYEKKLMNPWMEYILNYRKNDFRIAIMMFQFPPLNNDTTVAFKKAKACLNLLNNSVLFNQLAKDSSDDKQTGVNGGEIPYYVTAGQAQRPIENVVFNLKVGEYSKEIIKTKYGFFLVKVLDIQPRSYVKGRHILIGFEPNIDSSVAFKRADSVLNQLKKGVNFSKLANDVSTDVSTAKKGGDFGYYCRSTGLESSPGQRFTQEFEKGLFSLKDGQTSGKVISPYGIHIIIRDSSKNADIDKEKSELKTTYKRLYYDLDKKKFLDSLYTQYKFNVNNDVLKEFLSLMDTTKTNMDSVWKNKLVGSINDKVLYSFLNENTTIKSFVDLISRRNEYRGTALNNDGIRKAIDKDITPKVFKEATKYLENEYPDFANLMREFRDGILLFKVEAIEVWDNLKFDTISAKIYWESSKTKYMTDKEYDFSEIYVLQDSVSKQLYDKIKSGEDFEKLAEANTQRPGYREKKGHWALQQAKSNKLAKILEEKHVKEADVIEPQSFEKGYTILKLNKISPPRQKTFEEAISDFAPTFQDLNQKNLIEKWLNKVKVKFPLKIYEDKIPGINK